MKKYISLALLCFATLCLSAQNYKHSIGGMVGSMYGVSYKGFIWEWNTLLCKATWACA